MNQYTSERGQVPSLEELDGASGQQLKMLQEAMGGDYGYNMGFVEDGRLLRASNLRNGSICIQAWATGAEPLPDF